MAIRPIRRLLCANRGEIAIRVFRAATELNIETIAVFSAEDRVHLHRYKADEAYRIPGNVSPVGAYLSVEKIIEIAKENHVDAIHPGYGFLSENADFAARCQAEGIVFVGPEPATIRALGDKTTARELAKSAQVPVVPGSEGAVQDLATAQAFVQAHGLPIIIKAAHGGGGRGMRVVRSAEELDSAFEQAKSEAKSAFGDDTIFIERFIERPRHIEVQILADQQGDVVHLYERDCSVQRRHQKVVEYAPAINFSSELRHQLCEDALRIARAVNYRNAGTVEFLVDENDQHYFIEVNPRIQVEHTVTEQVTGIDLVQAQIRIAEGHRLSSLGLVQEEIKLRGHAIQCRVTTEDPTRGFQPDSGRIEVFRSAGGLGIRLDGGAGYAGARISPFYDSLLVKVTGQSLTFDGAAQKLNRALAEFRVRGVKTNIPFLQRVLSHPTFLSGNARTNFIDTSPELFHFPLRRNRAQRLLHFLGHVAVNGAPLPVNSVESKPSSQSIEIPDRQKASAQEGWRQVLLDQGPAAFAKQIRAHKPLLLTDTTWRDAHQSLLATRIRTTDLLAIAPTTAQALQNCFSLEMWGGATFDVALRFLRECPWERLSQLRELVPNIPFQMLLRGANAVGYTNYPDNVVYRFVKQARDLGVDVFRVFDCLNYVENLKLGIDAVGQANGVIEAAICYTGDISDPVKSKYSLDYYVDLAGQLVDLGTHVLAVKDMAGLLKPQAASQLVGALRAAFPDTPIHMHTHDTAGTGVASMMIAAKCGADIVDVATSAMAGLTSQPAMSAVIAGMEGHERDTGFKTVNLNDINDYWEQVRSLYSPFESGLKSGSSDVYEHEMPGGQYTNLQFQAASLGLNDRWSSIKRAYAEANRLLGDIIKVTPSSKVVGDLAQFMVQNDLDGQSVLDQAKTLSFPRSVVEFLQGQLGEPHGGFPEPFRSHVLGEELPIEGRPGASMPDLDFAQLETELKEKWGDHLKAVDITSAALYPQVFDEYRQFRRKYGDVSVLPTRYFIHSLNPGEELCFEIERGKTLVVQLNAIGDLVAGQREVFFELNGQPRSLSVKDESADDSDQVAEQADPADPLSIGAPMPGVVVEVHVAQGDVVKANQPLLAMNAMKMETSITSPTPARVGRVAVKQGDSLQAGCLLVQLEEIQPDSDD